MNTYDQKKVLCKQIPSLEGKEDYQIGNDELAFKFYIEYRIEKKLREEEQQDPCPTL